MTEKKTPDTPLEQELKALIDQLHQHAEDADDDVAFSLAFKIAAWLAKARGILKENGPSPQAEDSSH